MRKRAERVEVSCFMHLLRSESFLASLICRIDALFQQPSCFVTHVTGKPSASAFLQGFARGLSRLIATSVSIAIPLSIPLDQKVVYGSAP